MLLSLEYSNLYFPFTNVTSSCVALRRFISSLIRLFLTCSDNILCRSFILARFSVLNTCIIFFLLISSNNGSMTEPDSLIYFSRTSECFSCATAESLSFLAAMTISVRVSVLIVSQLARYERSYS